MVEQPPLHGIDGPRPLPQGLRARLEAELLSAAAGAEPMPDAARDRLAEQLTDRTAAVLHGVDGPRPLPAALRTRVEAALRTGVGTVHVARAGRRPRALTAPWLAAAACLALLVASVTVLSSRPGGGRAPVAIAPEVDAGDQAGADAVSGSGSFQNAPDSGATGGSVSAGELGTGLPGAVTPQSRTVTAGGSAARRDAPPYAFEGFESAALTGEGGTGGGAAAASTTGTTTPPPPFRYKALTGDPVEAAGFNAYVNLLNDGGGAGGRRFVAVSGNGDVTVNLSGAPFTDRTRPTGIGLDAFLAPESSLHGGVFAFGGVPERQAHLIVDAVYPGPAPANTAAAVYRAEDGPLGTTVADAVVAVLRERGVRPVDVAVRRGQPVPAVPADAVFLSLDPADAGRVVSAYGSAAAPPKGFNGVGTLADPSAPSGMWVLSPYAMPSTAEAHDLEQRSKHKLSARLIHGWVAAKTLAVAVWREDPRSPAALRAALERMTGYGNGFAPAYSFRPGTHSVQPDGVLLQAGVQAGGFRTDAR